MTRDKRVLIQAISFFVLLLSLVVSQASAGWVITTESAWEENDKLLKATATTYLQKGLGVKTTTPEGYTTIQRVDTRTTYFVDDEVRQYEVVAWDEMKQRMIDAEEQLEKVLEELEDVPPEVREMIAQRMKRSRERAKGPEEGQVHVEKAGKQQEILGYKAEQYVVSEEDGETYEIWVSRSRKLNGLIKEWKEVMEPLSKEMTQSMQETPSLGHMQALRQIEGFPLLVVTPQDGAPLVTYQVMKIERTELKEADFLPPAGYTENPFEE